MQMAIPLTQCMLEQHFLRHLIKQAKDGDVAAFERILNVHERAVLRFAQQILLNRDAAKDASQEVFVRLYKNIRSIDETRDLMAWIYRTTSNVCYDILRRTKRHMPLDVLVEPVDSTPNPEESLCISEQRQLVIAALKGLSTREREVVALRDFEGQSVSEIASILKITEGTVRSQLSTGRVKIKNFVSRSLKR